MANKPNNTKVRGKGFYIAMYSGLAGILVLAVAIGYNSLLSPDLTGNYDTVPVSARYEEESLTVSGAGERPVVNIPRPDQRQAAEPVQPYQNGHQTPTQPHTQPGQEQRPPVEAVPLPDAVEGQPAPAQQQQPATNQQNQQGQPQQNQPTGQPGQQQPNQEAQATPPAQNVPTEQGQPPSEGQQPITLQELLDVVFENWDEQDLEALNVIGQGFDDFNIQQVFDHAGQNFTAFTDNDDMHWPVVGDIVMDFSMDSHVFDPTLDQWRVNDGISIGANQGDVVRAAADGRVRQVDMTPQFGKVVVIDHGNGWTTTYRQLAEDINVAAGDVVNRGQIIGNVGSPSIFAGGLGYHMTFNVRHDDNVINPHAILSVTN
ncbi:MAG: M23 family metallopeptidase [Defluviitaleaceae bacterium]|nr:M23 family metallopeptidase [Defluviitaleaceae bacterium]